MREKVTAQRIEDFMRGLASGITEASRVFFVGGATAVLLGWRDSTIDIDLKVVPDNDEVLRKFPTLKEKLHINIELAAPDDFIPALPGWEDRSRFIRQEEKLTFLHYDLYAQALAKLERRHKMDYQDVDELLRRKLIDPEILFDLFSQIKDQLYKYPAIDATAFCRAVEEATKKRRD
ncbi:MAG: hypothetical protein QOF62_3522 [Pyrinomonadaceae bacterium]|jgi:hypothetical protein|nr:hypothetical protein [Pyrinomonadaceae bacterium]